MKMKIAVSVVSAVLWAASLHAQSILIPRDNTVPPLSLKSQRVVINIDNQVAQVRVEQVFLNPTDRDLEADYYFPIPQDASIKEFAMWMNGQRVKGELLDSGKARGIYEEIVRKRRDPALLEYMGCGLLRMRVFPVPRRGEQKIELEYSHLLRYDSGLVQFTFPLKTDRQTIGDTRDFSVAVKLRSSQPLRSIYSPTHTVDVQRRSDHEAVIGFEPMSAEAMTRQNFTLYYGVSEKDIGLTLITRRVPDKKGFFLLLVSPKKEIEDAEIVAKDVCLVIDTSGSMAGEKIRQAREALKFCINSLNARDRFSMIRFSTDTESFTESLLDATSENRKRALDWVDKLEARGGTAIDDALRSSLKLDHRADRPFVVVFITDGLPTIGEQEPQRILKNVREMSSVSLASIGKGVVPASGVRLFTFGVGYDVNTHLLDQLAAENRGVSEYVAPQEDLEMKISSFFAKVSQPVLADVSLDIDGVKFTDVYPRQMPDLFAGNQLAIFGRYEGAGKSTITLRGTVNGKRRSFTVQGDFARTSTEHDFIESLWATRKVGYLLDEIRLHGENGELRDEVVQLSKQYGIITPYTSYLIVEDTRPAAVAERSSGTSRLGSGVRIHEPAPPVSAVPAPMPKASRLGEEFKSNGTIAIDKATSGERAVADSKSLRALKQTDAESYRDLQSGAVSMRFVNGKTFQLRGEVWLDSDAEGKSVPMLDVQFGSKAYFDLLAKYPDLKPFFTLGTKVTVQFKKVVIQLGDAGKTELSAEDWQSIE
jgi:Ca-activated chloride channel family protein